MVLDNINKLLLAGASLCLGAYLAALRTKISTTRAKNSLHVAFYIIAGLFFLGALITFLCFWNEIFFKENKINPDWFTIGVLLSCIASTIVLVAFTIRNFSGKFQYKTPELDPIVNKFTKDADKTNIRLLAGDINFFGNSPQEMNKNSQYSCLKDEGFNEIQILCWKPQNDEAKKRYGKIITDMPQTVLRYYRPPHADLMIRGRLKTLNNVTHLLMYNKIRSGLYEAILSDLANSSGAMYNHLWNLIWEMAETPSLDEINAYKLLSKH